MVRISGSRSLCGRWRDTSSISQWVALTPDERKNSVCHVMADEHERYVIQRAPYTTRRRFIGICHQGFVVILRRSCTMRFIDLSFFYKRSVGLALWLDCLISGRQNALQITQQVECFEDSILSIETWVHRLAPSRRIRSLSFMVHLKIQDRRSLCRYFSLRGSFMMQVAGNDLLYEIDSHEIHRCSQSGSIGGIKEWPQDVYLC